MLPGGAAISAFVLICPYFEPGRASFGVQLSLIRLVCLNYLAYLRVLAMPPCCSDGSMNSLLSFSTPTLWLFPRIIPTGSRDATESVPATHDRIMPSFPPNSSFSRTFYRQALSVTL